MGPPILVLSGIVLVLGLPLLFVAILVGTWLRRSNRACALKTYVGTAIFGGISFLSFFGAIAVLIAIAVHEKRHPAYFETHPFAPLLMIGLGLLAFGAALMCALFGAWTLWRLVQAPPAQPLGTTTTAA